MSISLTCEKCGKKIKAPDDGGGKYGSCPKCNHKCYIPLPVPEGEEELTLTPVDDDSEVNHDELMKQTHSLTENILHETAMPDDDVDDDRDGYVSEREVLKHIIMWVRQMVAGQLEQADSTAKKLTSHSVMAKDLIKRLQRSGTPEPEFADIAPRLLTGLMKQLYSHL